MPDYNKIIIFSNINIKLGELYFDFLEVKVFIRLMLLWHFVPAVKTKISQGFYESIDGSTCKKS
jgi:hypothetical protein